MATYSKYLKTTGASIITPAISIYYSLMNGFGLKGGASYALAKGDQANYMPGNPPTMVSGSMFSNYKTYGAYLGYWWQLPASFEFSGQVAYYKTTYNHETAPVPAGQASPADRTDTLNQYSFDLLYSVIPNKWVFDLSASFSKNGSTGFQGLPTYGSLTTYKYDRNYYLLTTTYYY